MIWIDLGHTFVDCQELFTKLMNMMHEMNAFGRGAQEGSA